MSVGWYLMADGKAAGYAFMLRHPAAPYVLLDYLAMEEQGPRCGQRLPCPAEKRVSPGHRRRGGGGRSGSGRRDCRAAPSAHRLLSRAGFIPCPFPNRIFDVHYLVHLWHPAAPERPAPSVAAALDTLYALQYPDAEYRNNVFIDVPEEG